MIDFLARERHFADHLAPIWHARHKPRGLQDRFFAPDDLWGHTASLGINPLWPPVPDRPILVASYGDLKRARKVGYQRIALIEHGYGQTFSDDHPSYAGGRDRDDVSLFLVPNKHAADRNRERNPDAKVEIVGCPKLDTLPTRRPGPLTIAVSFHWDCWRVPESASAFSYYRAILPALAEQYRIIGHGHPRAFSGPPLLERRYSRMQIPIVREFADVCRMADLYICDYSSTLYEFASTGRPVVVLNAPHYRKDVHHGLRFWDAIPGIEVDEPGDLLAAVATALEDPPHLREQREAALDMVYAYRSGAAERAARALEEWSR